MDINSLVIQADLSRQPRNSHSYRVILRQNMTRANVPPLKFLQRMIDWTHSCSMFEAPMQGRFFYSASIHAFLIWLSIFDLVTAGFKRGPRVFIGIETKYDRHEICQTLTIAPFREASAIQYF